jgi:hypothetical protein
MAAGLTPSNNDLTQLTQAIELLGRIPYVIDQGVANMIVVNPDPIITVYANEIVLAIKVAVGNTGAVTINVSGLGPIPLHRPSGAALIATDLSAGAVILVAFDGSIFQLLSVPGSLGAPTAQQLWRYAVDVSGTANSIVATVDNIGTSWPVGLPVAIKVGNTNSGATTVTLNGLAAMPLKRGSGTSLQLGDVAAGYIALMICDGAEAQLINPQIMAGAPGSGDTIVDQLSPYWLSVKSYNTPAPPSLPAVGDDYLIPIGATGSWAGLDGRVAQFTVDGWVQRAYPTSSLVGTSDTLEYWQNIGGNAWKEVVIPTSGALLFFGQL